MPPKVDYSRKALILSAKLIYFWSIKNKVIMVISSDSYKNNELFDCELCIPKYVPFTNSRMPCDKRGLDLIQYKNHLLRCEIHYCRQLIWTNFNEIPVTGLDRPREIGYLETLEQAKILRIEFNSRTIEKDKRSLLNYFAANGCPCKDELGEKCEIKLKSSQLIFMHLRHIERLNQKLMVFKVDGPKNPNDNSILFEDSNLFKIKNDLEDFDQFGYFNSSSLRESCSVDYSALLNYSDRKFEKPNTGELNQNELMKDSINENYSSIHGKVIENSMVNSMESSMNRTPVSYSDQFRPANVSPTHFKYNYSNTNEPMKSVNKPIRMRMKSHLYVHRKFSFVNFLTKQSLNERDLIDDKLFDDKLFDDKLFGDKAHGHKALDDRKPDYEKPDDYELLDDILLDETILESLSRVQTILVEYSSDDEFGKDQIETQNELAKESSSKDDFVKIKYEKSNEIDLQSQQKKIEEELLKKQFNIYEDCIVLD